MTRDEAVAFLKRRLAFAQDKKYNYYDNEDMVVIRNYISHIHNKLVDLNAIRNSFTSRPFEQVSNHMDNMMNHMIEHFKIEIVADERMDIFRNKQLLITDYK